jgi:La domain
MPENLSSPTMEIRREAMKPPTSGVVTPSDADDDFNGIVVEVEQAPISEDLEVLAVDAAGSESTPPPLVASTTSSATMMSGSAEQQQQQLMYETLQALARQLEYYFSKPNLAKDMYLQTLRSLNDGCVPVNILANFAKVKAILTPQVVNNNNNNSPHQHGGGGKKPTLSATELLLLEETRTHSILQAVNEYTELLQIHSIDTVTGRIVSDETPSSAITILAVGPTSDDGVVVPCPPVAVSTSMAALESTSTIILRDVQPVVTEAEIRELFASIPDCPAIMQAVSDVAYHWYVVSIKVG